MHQRPTTGAYPKRLARSERGVTLILTLLTLGLMLLLGLALTMSSMSGVIVSGSYERDTRSFYIAEAGINHALSIFRGINGDPNNTGTLTGDLNGDGRFDFSDVLYGSSASQGQLLIDSHYIPSTYTIIPSGGLTIGSGINGGTYTVRVFDDDNPVVNFASPGLPPNEGNAGTADPLVDHNNRLIVRSIGTAATGARTVIDAEIGFIVFPALLTQGSISLSGNSTISGQYGSVHTNTNLSLSGSTSIAQSATASGTISQSGSPSVGGFESGNQPVIPIPDLNPFPAAGDVLPQNFFISKADLVMVKNLTDLTDAWTKLGYPVASLPASVPASGYAIRTSDQTLQTPSTYGWSLSGTTWSPSGAAAGNNQAYFAYGDMDINGGTYTMTVVATGHYHVNGNAAFTPYWAGSRAIALPGIQPPFAKIDLLFLAGTDFWMNGNASESITYNGVIYAGEQVKLLGNATFYGQVLAKDRSSSDSYITADDVQGNFTLNFNNSTGVLGSITLIAWRQVKQF